jgi:hypothetical protein
MSQPEYKYKLNDPDYKGEKTSSEMRGGPKSDRGCSDILMLLLFIISWGVFCYIAFMGFKNGDPSKIDRPYDSAGNQCGVGNYSSYTDLFFIVDASVLDASMNTVCVDSCPDSTTGTVSCMPNANVTTCPTDPYQTASLFRICLPTGAATIGSAAIANITNAIGMTGLQQDISDIKSVWYMILAVAGIALVISFLYTFVVRFCAGFMTWAIIILYLGLLLGFGFLCYNLANNPDSTNIAGSDVLKNMSQTSLKIFAYTSFTILGISLLLICFFFHRITLAIGVLKCAAQFVEEVPSIIFVPLLFFFVLIGYMVFWLFSFVFVVSSNEVQATGNPWPDIVWTSSSKFQALYCLFHYLWNHAFLVALPQFVIAGACVVWYWRKAHEGKLGHPVGWALCSCMPRHIGSVAFGALIIAIIEFIKYLFTYIHAKMKSAHVAGGAAGFCMSCVGCCLDCFERFVRFINAHAYIQIAMTGENFCKAAEESFFLVARFAFSLGFVHGIGSVFVFIGTIFITLISTFLGWLILTRELSDQVFSSFGPTLVFFVVSYVIGSNFMSIYGMSADTIIHCFCIDSEAHDGGPQHAPPLLNEFVETHKDIKPLHQKLMGGGGN